jgi:hypothetical protein
MIVLVFNSSNKVLSISEKLLLSNAFDISGVIG